MKKFKGDKAMHLQSQADERWSRESEIYGIPHGAAWRKGGREICGEKNRYTA